MLPAFRMCVKLIYKLYLGSVGPLATPCPGVRKRLPSKRSVVRAVDGPPHCLRHLNLCSLQTRPGNQAV